METPASIYLSTLTHTQRERVYSAALAFTVQHFRGSVTPIKLCRFVSVSLQHLTSITTERNMPVVFIYTQKPASFSCLVCVWVVMMWLMAYLIS